MVSSSSLKVAEMERKRRPNLAFHNLSVGQDHVEPGFDPNGAAGSVGLNLPGQTPFSAPMNANSAQTYPGVSPIGSTLDQNVQQMANMHLGQQQVPQNAHAQHQAHHQPAAPPVQSSLSVSEIRNNYNAMYLRDSFYSFENVTAPLSGTCFRAIDQSTATPKFARLSMYSMPHTEELRNKTKIPLAMELNPFADHNLEKDEEVPQIDVRDIQFVPRCRRCRAYLNCGMKIMTHDMTCNICGFQSPLPSEYFGMLDMRDNRTDYETRPEFHRGVVDYIVPKEYNWNEIDESVPMHRVFLIDVSKEAYKLKLVDAACEAIKVALYQKEGELTTDCKISIIAYDVTLHFFDLSKDSKDVSISIISDLVNPFTPFEEGLFVNPSESKDIIIKTLDYIQNNPTPSQYDDNAFGAAVKAAGLALKDVSNGGQIIATLSKLPIIAPGNLSLKVNSVNEIEWVKSLCTPNDKYYQNVLSDFVENNVSLNLLIGSENSVDLGNLGNLALKSGGSIREWLHYLPARDEITFIYTFKEMFDSQAGYQCQLKMRCSHGLLVKKYYGDFKTVDDSGSAVAIPNVGANTNIVCEFAYNGELDTKKDAHFQAALLYTSKDGVRKVRVINSIVSVTQRLHDVFGMVDQDAIIKFLLRESLDRFVSGSLAALKNSLLMKISEINAAYRVNTEINQSQRATGGLILPASLSSLPMMILAIWKTRAFANHVNVPDLRMSSYYDLMSFNSTRLSALLYPLLICLHDLEEDDCTLSESTSMFKMPQTLPLSYKNLQHGGAYLIFDGQRCTIWLHNQVHPMLIADLFGADYQSIDDLTNYVSTLPVLPTAISQQVRSLVCHLAVHYCNMENMSVEVCRAEKDQNEVQLLPLFVEDANGVMDPSYSEFLKMCSTEMEKKMGQSSRASHSGSLAKDDGVSLTHRFGF